MAKVAVIIGSKTDEPYVKPALEILEALGIECEFLIISAHRNPDKLRDYATNASGNGIEVIIAAAGASAALPGAISSWNKGAIPVIGVPLPTSDLKGIDSLYSIVQMPSGVPVACMGIGSSGAKNAALLSAQILSLKYPGIKESYDAYKAKNQNG
jgi:5-(carboxyamino)imidazole ribonucleotide mutase